MEREGGREYRVVYGKRERARARRCVTGSSRWKFIPYARVDIHVVVEAKEALSAFCRHLAEPPITQYTVRRLTPSIAFRY